MELRVGTTRPFSQQVKFSLHRRTVRNFPVIILTEHGKPTMSHEEMCEYMRAIGQIDRDREDGVE
jgi:hypothetical protein